MPKDHQPDKPGPEPERLKIEGNWTEAVQKALRKGKTAPEPANQPDGPGKTKRKAK